MKRLILAIVLISVACVPAPAQAAFGLKELDVTLSAEPASVSMEAGSHPLAMTTFVKFNTVPDPKLGEVPDGAAKDLFIALPPGFVANPSSVERCSALTFIESATVEGVTCPDDTVVGITKVELNSPGEFFSVPVYNLAPAPGQLLKLGFVVLKNPVALEAGLNPMTPFNGLVSVTNLNQTVPVFSAETTIWGVPASHVHDKERGACLGGIDDVCPVLEPDVPFLTLPGNCEGSLSAVFRADSWQEPGVFDEPGPVPFHGEGELPGALSGCDTLLFGPTISAQPTNQSASSPTGLDFSLNLDDQGIISPTGRSQSEVRKAVVTLPKGFTTNPAVAAGLEGCSESDLRRESVSSAPGFGCPEASKIGGIEVESPLLEEGLEGSVYVATPFENPFHSLLALYMVIRNPSLGVFVTQPLKVETDPVSGQITTVAENLPQLPFSRFALHLRSGSRSPLTTPPGCGTYDVEGVLTPWSGAPPLETGSTIQISTGSDGGPCPTGASFVPGLIGGTLDNSGGRFSPLYLRLTRSDAERELGNFAIKLPPGLVAKLSGVPFCPEAAIEAARGRGGPGGAHEELQNPSCPLGSEVGHTLVGAGVGPALTYVPGKVYLAGPYHGSPLSLVAITAARVGPFDLGTVVVREALRIDPVTAEVSTDLAESDPLPRIIEGIPLHLRDVRVYMDKADFVLNPTSCQPALISSTLLGVGPGLLSGSTGSSASASTPFQAAGCASLGFKPKITLRLKGGTRRGAHPALRAVLRPRPGDANPSRISIQLPHSEFLEQGHIRTICTRIQFAAGAGNGAQCPAGAVYARARAWSPLLADPLEGPVFLRSSNHPLPDLVLALHGLIDFNAVGRISSVKGGITNTFDFVPDVPISKVIVDFHGGKKGLLVNSTNICKGRHKATARFTAQNGRTATGRPSLRVKCGKGRKGGKRHHSSKGS